MTDACSAALDSQNPRKTIPDIPLAEHKHVEEDKKGLFDVEYVKARSTWARSTKSTLINARESAAKLSALGFDPIETMVKKFDEVQTIIDQVMMSSKPSMIAIAQLLTLQQKISNDLLKYGYNQVPDRSETPPEIEPMGILLTD
jgi:hypothetical protein